MAKKQIKKIIIVIISLLLIISLAFGGVLIYKNIINKEETKELDKEEEKKASSTPLLYEVTKEGTDNKIYLFGSIHAADSRAYPMQDKIIEAFNNSNYLAVEVDIVALEKNLTKQFELIPILLCEQNKTLQDYMHNDTYQMLIEYMKENKIYDRGYEAFKPAMIYSLLSNEVVTKSKLNTKLGIDEHFLKEAKKANKTILELESAEFQFTMLANLDNDLMDFMIKYFILNEDEEVKELTNLYEAWINGDLEKIIDFIEEIDNENNIDVSEYKNLESLMEEYNNEMINKRNSKMLENIDNYFKENKNTFVVVGAAHIVGEEGVTNKLKELGYSVNLINY